MSGTTVRVHWIYPKKRKYYWEWPKSGRNQNKNDDRCQGPSDGSLAGWSHDQFPKTKVVALHCSFWNQFESCSKVLPLWRYDVKAFSECCVFFFCFLFLFFFVFCFFCIFLYENNTKSHDFNTFGNLWERATTIVLWEISPEKEGAYPKREINTKRLQRSLIGYSRLQKSDIDYNTYW